MRNGDELTWAGAPALPGASALNAVLSYAGGMIVCAALIVLSLDQAARLTARSLAPVPTPSAAGTKLGLRDIHVSGASNAAIIAEMEARQGQRAATQGGDHAAPRSAN